MKKNGKIKILFLDILTGSQKLRRERHEKVFKGNTYSEIMRRAFRLRAGEWSAVDASRGRFPKKLSSFDGIVIGGSLEDPLPGTEKPWVKQTYAIIKKAIREKIPILGICGGLQFTARALGGNVIRNPKGREFGCINVGLTKEGSRDLLFNGLPRNITAASSHECMVAGLRPGWRLLASSKLCSNQAIAIGDRIRLLQFHPEKTASMLKNTARINRGRLFAEGFFKDEIDYKKFTRSIKNTERNGKKILYNFLRYFVLNREENPTSY